MLSQTEVWSDEEYSNFCIVQIAELTQADLKGMNNSIISIYNVGIVSDILTISSHHNNKATPSSLAEIGFTWAWL